ncbi:hypothetical protein [Paenibacillus durus]|uniref:Serine protease n=1 Tax=Paenibacillus durus ATCC 35681 TaxID=1333534 RepID=A0A0F7FEJ7_PAEDU|nr:hypothetical protein [Paenibacillus durus]AKG37430.1 hypothetical protein VK70_25605 [Paenibacillus durus ATCC 35681]
MSYFRLSQDDRFPNAVQPQGVTAVIRPDMLDAGLAEQRSAEQAAGQAAGQSAGQRNSLEELSLQFAVAEAAQVDYVDFIEYPVPFVSNRVKRTIEIFAPMVRFVPGVFTDLPRRHQEVYWLVAAPQVDCLSDESEWHPDGRLRRLVLDAGRAGGQPFFQVNGPRERIWLINLALAEGLLRRDFNGIRLTRVEQS